MGTTPELSKSAKLFQERRIPQDVLTQRTPGPRLDLDNNLLHRLPLKPPYPLPEVLQMEADHPPDAGATLPWPHGEEEIS